MSALINCKACGKEVSKSAKSCPHCGQKLKMGMFMKALIGIMGLVVLGIIISPSKEQREARMQKQGDDLIAAQAVPLDPHELGEVFKLGSKHTDIQRDNKEKEILGQIIEWTLPVFEVKKVGEKYRVQTSASKGLVGTFADITPRNEDDRQLLENFKTGEYIRIKGRIDGVLLRHIEIQPAVLITDIAAPLENTSRSIAGVAKPERTVSPSESSDNLGQGTFSPTSKVGYNSLERITIDRKEIVFPKTEWAAAGFKDTELGV